MSGCAAPEPGRFALSPEERRALTGFGTIRAYPKNAVILNEGDPADSLYVILEGRVKFFVADADGKEAVLSTHGAGEYFGELMLDGGPRSASAVTLEPSRFLLVPKAEFRRFLLHNPGFTLRLVDKLIHHVRTLTESVKSLALMDVYGRIARLLLELAREVDGRLVIAGAAHPARYSGPGRRLARDGEPDPERSQSRWLHPQRRPSARHRAQAAAALVSGCSGRT